MFSRLVHHNRAAMCAGVAGMSALSISAVSEESTTRTLCASHSTSDKLNGLDARLDALEKFMAASNPESPVAVAGAITVEPLAAPLKDTVWEVPGSKSITNRALILAALRTGTTHLSGEFA